MEFFSYRKELGKNFWVNGSFNKYDGNIVKLKPKGPSIVIRFHLDSLIGYDIHKRVKEFLRGDDYFKNIDIDAYS